MLHAHVDTSGLDAIFDRLRDRAKDVESVLREFSTEHKQPEVQARFDNEGPDWPARKAETAKRAPFRNLSAEDRAVLRKIPGGDQVQKLAALRLNRKLGRELRRAEKMRMGRIVKAHRSKREKAAASADRAIARRREVIAEFARIVAGGSTAPTGNKAADKRTQKLMERFGRAEKRAAGKVLGRIAQSIKASVAGGKLTLKSEIEWAGVHNKGGMVGRGAEIPERTFLEWTEEDIRILGDMLREHLLTAFD